MTQTTHPSKQDVRDYLRRRVGAHVPPPDGDEIRRQLGWGLVEAERIATQDLRGGKAGNPPGS